MAKTLQQISTALAARTASFASFGLSSAAEVAALAQFLEVAGRNPGATAPLLRLTNNKEITENR